MYEISCSPVCGFKIQSHDEKEAVDIAIKHLKTRHNQTMSADEVKKTRMKIIA